MNYSLSKKVLILKKPMIYGYTILGTIFSIIEDKDLPWIYSNFIQIMYHDDWQMFIFEEQIDLLPKCPFLKIEYLTFDKNSNKNESFVETLINIINNNYYIYLFLDWKYIIPNIAKNNFAHSTLISGYDIKRRIFYLSDNYENGKFITLEIDMNTVEEAFYSAWLSSVGNKNDNNTFVEFSYLKTIIAFKYDKNLITRFDLISFIEQLNCFINSDSIYLFGEKNSKYHGYLSYNLIINDLLNENKLCLGTKNFHLLYEHKYLMLRRIEYMVQNNVISSSNNYIETAKDICNEFLIIRNLFIKSQFANNPKKLNIILNICDRIKRLKDSERILYENIINYFSRNS